MRLDAICGRKDFLPWWAACAESQSRLFFAFLHKIPQLKYKKGFTIIMTKSDKQTRRPPQPQDLFCFFIKPISLAVPNVGKKVLPLNPFELFFTFFRHGTLRTPRFLNARPPCSCRSDWASDFERLMMCCVVLVVETSASKREHYGLL